MKPRDTNRLTFRYVTLDDVEFLARLDQAPGVLKFLDHTPPSIEHIRARTIPDLLKRAQAHPGYGLWIARLRASNEPIGWMELEPDQPNPGDADVGYRLLPDYWGNGFATEGGAEMVRYAFEDLQAERVTANTMFVNTPSRKVMERIGLKHVRTYHEHFDDPLPGTEKGEVEYALTRDEWLALRRA